MYRSSLRFWSTAVLAAVFTSACATAPPQTTPGPASPPDDISRNPAAMVAADGGIPPYTEADVKFMQGMIAHHGQAITMAALALTNTTSNDVRVLAARIDVAQRDEIALMQRWLRRRGQAVPDPMAGAGMAGHHAGHDMSTASGAPTMPGMLTAEQLAQLRAAKGVEFDRLFLTFMIQHHDGAVEMVNELFASTGSGQDTELWQLAADIEADQGSEIARMLVMLEQRPPGTQDR